MAPQKIKQREEKYPDNVDKMPVKTHQLDGSIIASREPTAGSHEG
jgi:hypothetical protein